MTEQLTLTHPIQNNISNISTFPPPNKSCGGSGGLVAKSCLTLTTPWTIACQAPLSTGFPRPEYWSGLPFPLPGDLPNPEIEPASLMSPALQTVPCTVGRFFTNWAKYMSIWILQFHKRTWNLKIKDKGIYFLNAQQSVCAPGLHWFHCPPGPWGWYVMTQVDPTHRENLCHIWGNLNLGNTNLSHWAASIHIRQCLKLPVSPWSYQKNVLLHFLIFASLVCEQRYITFV